MSFFGPVISLRLEMASHDANGVTNVTISFLMSGQLN